MDYSSTKMPELTDIYHFSIFLYSPNEITVIKQIRLSNTVKNLQDKVFTYPKTTMWLSNNTNKVLHVFHFHNSISVPFPVVVESIYILRNVELNIVKNFGQEAPSHFPCFL